MHANRAIKVIEGAVLKRATAIQPLIGADRKVGVEALTQTIAPTGPRRDDAGDRLIANEMVHGTYARLKADQQITGEWLIFGVHAGKRYYLTAASHDEGDAVIFDRIDRVAFAEFPFLRACLIPAASTKSSPDGEEVPGV